MPPGLPPPPPAFRGGPGQAIAAPAASAAPGAVPRAPAVVALRKVVTVLALGALVLAMAGCGLLILAAITSSTGVTGFLVGVVLAAVPVPLVVAAFRWIDRYEPEPRGLLLFCFAWGAAVAALAAGFLNSVTIAVLAGADGRAPGSALTTSAIFVAPWVEEAAKGAALLAVLLVRRREVDGVVDGIVLAGVVGVGFAFTENILYFGRAFLAGAQDLGVSGGLFAVGFTFVLRGLLSPFAHPLFTVMTGIGIGVAARTRTPVLRVLAPLVGYLLAVALHSLWNASATGSIDAFLAGYLLFMVPVFATATAIALWSRAREGRVVATALPRYVEAGWLTSRDVVMLASLAQRRVALRWARGTSGRAGRGAMRRFQAAATELAFLRHNAERSAAYPPDFARREAALLADLARSRQALSLPAR